MASAGTEMKKQNGEVTGDSKEVIIDCHIRQLFYGSFRAVRDTTIPVQKNSITAFIGDRKSVV